jgi:hypothetical protein
MLGQREAVESEEVLVAVDDQHPVHVRNLFIYQLRYFFH